MDSLPGIPAEDHTPAAQSPGNKELRSITSAEKERKLTTKCSVKDSRVLHEELERITGTRRPTSLSGRPGFRGRRGILNVRGDAAPRKEVDADSFSSPDHRVYSATNLVERGAKRVALRCPDAAALISSVESTAIRAADDSASYIEGLSIC